MVDVDTFLTTLDVMTDDFCQISLPPEPVWPKNSCSFTLIVFEEASKSFTTSNRAGTFRVLANGRKEQHIVLALMIALVMIMLHVLLERMPERGFTKQNHPRQRFVFD